MNNLLGGETHHRHAQPQLSAAGTGSSGKSVGSDEDSPLIFTRHMSFLDDEESEEHSYHPNRLMIRSLQCFYRFRKPLFFLLIGLISFGCCMLIVFLTTLAFRHHASSYIIPIELAVEHTIPLEHGKQLWFRTWGNPNGIPVLFVHGGPGNAIEDYHNGNKKFFSDRLFWVVEVDQRGTGKSQPSVRDDWRNMAHYKDISIDQICQDFEKVRKALQIDQWLVFGGSFGSTLTINYGTRYPERCLAIIIRGLYLDTPVEVSAVYSRSSFSDHPHRQRQFDILYNYAKNYAIQQGEEPSDPDDAPALLRLYERMILSGDKYAIWNWHVFENNLMEEDPRNLLDPAKIDKTHFPEAQSIAFFETRLWLHGSFENPSNLLDRVDKLVRMPVWVCQGRRDKVCPPQYAHKFVNALDDAQGYYTARFIDSGHEQTDPTMAECLKESLYEFLNGYS